MNIKDVKVGMKVVPHAKTYTSESLEESRLWMSAGGKDQGFMCVIRKEHGCCVLAVEEDDIGGDYFNASDFEPYIEPSSKHKFGGYIQGNKTVIYFGEKKGEANYNPNDAKQRLSYSVPYGLLLAYCRATGTDTAIVDRLFKKAEDKPTEPVKFEVGETARVRSDLNGGGLYGNFALTDGMLRLKGKIVTITENCGHGTYRIKEHCCQWTPEMFEKIPQNQKSVSHEVTIDGVKYVKEAPNEN